jgi:hypothetical protein
MEKLTEILKDLEQGKISADNAEEQVLRLFSVVGRSEQLLPKPCKICKTEIRIDVGDGLCAECWSRQ